MTKQKLKSNHGKSRYVLLGSAQFKAKTRRRQKKPQRGWEAILWEKKVLMKNTSGTWSIQVDSQKASLVP